MDKAYSKTLILPKSSTEKIGQFFHAKELKCRCEHPHCGVTILSRHGLKCLENLRLLVEQPLYVSSSYRCPEHNLAVGGSMKSRHLAGEAHDILCPDNFDLEAFAQLAKDAGFSFVKKYKEPLRIHADVR